MRRRAVGYSGRGKRNRGMTGHILLVSSTVGSLETLLSSYILTYAIMRDASCPLERIINDHIF
jgi:hypothetical protein